MIRSRVSSCTSNCSSTSSLDTDSSAPFDSVQIVDDESRDKYFQSNMIDRVFECEPDTLNSDTIRSDAMEICSYFLKLQMTNLVEQDSMRFFDMPIVPKPRDYIIHEILKSMSLGFISIFFILTLLV